MNSPHYRTKIIAGRLITVPVQHDPAIQNSGHYNFDRQHGFDITRYSPRNANKISTHSTNTVHNARLEAQRNKARAMQQTFHSVLDPEPQEVSSRSKTLPPNSLVCGIVSGVVSQSRHKLLTTLSSMRRRDPQENGVLTVYDVNDVLSLHNVSFDEGTKDNLLRRFLVADGLVNYRKMWKFVMDCYAEKDQIDIPTKDHQQQQENYHHLHQIHRSPDHHQSFPKSNAADSPLHPGLHTQLEHELRQYARANQKHLETNLLEEMFRSLDRYGTGKILKNQVGRLCQQYLHGVDINVLSSILVTCDADNSGLVDYEHFLNLLNTAQPTYLPPIGPSPPNLVANTDHYEVMIQSPTSYERFMNEEKDIIDYLARLSSPNLPPAFSKKYSNEAIPTGHAKELEKIGNIGLHLSDFETEVHTNKTVSKKHLVHEPLERSSTYDLGPPRPGTYDLKPRDEDREDKPSSSGKEEEETNESHSSVYEVRLPKTPSTGNGSNASRGHSPQRPPTMSKVSPTRKKWGTQTPRKIEKWWKQQDLASSFGSNQEELLKINRRTWGQSNRIKTVKGKRKRNMYRHKRKYGGKSQVARSESEHATATDFDSEAYTTTDIEVTDGYGSYDNMNQMLSPRNLVTKHQNESSTSLDEDEVDLKKHQDADQVLSEHKEVKGVDAVKYEAVKKTDEEHRTEKQRDLRTDIQQEEECEIREKKEDEKVAAEEEVANELKEKLVLQSPSTTTSANDDGGTVLEVKGQRYKLYPQNNITDIYNEGIGKTNQNKALQLEWVYGFNGEEVLSLSSTQCLITCGRVAVVIDTSKQTQRFFRKHARDITCCSVLPEEKTVATAQQWDGRKCIVYVWSPVHMATISCIHADQYENAVFKRMMLAKQNLLLCLVESVEKGHLEQYICLYNIKDSDMLTTTKVSHVIGLTMNSVGNNFVSSGKIENSLTFYENDGGSLDSKAASFGNLSVPKTISSAVFNNDGNLITGDSNGTIYLWITSTGQVDHVINHAHSACINAMCISKTGYLITGCSRDSCVKVWNPQLKKCLTSYKVCGQATSGVKSLSVWDDSLFIGASYNSILKIEMSGKDEKDDPLKNAEQSCVVVVEGHSDVITGITVDPVYKEMLTTLSADGTLHTYNTETRSIVSKTLVKGNGSCVTYHPSKEYLFVGCQDGSVHMFTSTNGSFIEKFKDIYSAITVIQVSKDGLKIACGSNEGALLVYLFDESSKMLEVIVNIKLFQEPVKYIDWETKNDILRVESIKPQLKYYGIKAQAVIDNHEDFVWSSGTCSIVYEKKEMWNKKSNKNGDFLTALSPAKDFLIECTPEKISLQRFHCLKNDENGFTTSGCVSPQTPSNVCFSCSGDTVYISHNKSGCLWQWKIVDK